MTNEEAKAELIVIRDNCLSSHDYDDQMRGIKKRALTAAIKEIENQQKYEKALELACEQLEKENDEYMADHKEEVCVLCKWNCEDGGCSHTGNGYPCSEKIVEYFKRKDGSEVPDGDADD